MRTATVFFRKSISRGVCSIQILKFSRFLPQACCSTFLFPLLLLLLLLFTINTQRGPRPRRDIPFGFPERDYPYCCCSSEKASPPLALFPSRPSAVIAKGQLNSPFWLTRALSAPFCFPFSSNFRYILFASVLFPPPIIISSL